MKTLYLYFEDGSVLMESGVRAIAAWRIPGVVYYTDHVWARHWRYDVIKVSVTSPRR